MIGIGKIFSLRCLEVKIWNIMEYWNNFRNRESTLRSVQAAKMVKYGL